MKRNQLLADRLREVLLRGKWIANTNFKEQILSLNYLQANTVVSNLNTIAALTYHVMYYIEGILNVLNGGKLEIKDKYSFDMPLMQSEEDWNKLVKQFIKSSEFLIEKIEIIDENLLDQPFVESQYGNYQRNLEALIEHCYYHLGQVSLIRKLIQN